MASLKISAAAFILIISSVTSVLSVQACPELPSTLPSVSNPKLVDPFTFIDGTKVVTKDDWTCRREELSQLFQRFELGILPPKPESVTGSIVENEIMIDVTHEGKSITFNASISLPAEPGTPPYPAIIAIGALTIPIPPDVAVITYNNDEIAAQNGVNSRGLGKFYDIYGESHPAGALVAWAWGVGRLIDVLETVADSQIDTSKLAVSGCSRNGKGVVVIGALEERIALTVPQEAGAGGSACWRISDAMKAEGTNVQTASQIITENVWLSPLFDQFTDRVPDLPFDHHLLASLVAPRGLLIIDHSGIDWLGAESVFGCMKTANKVYQALGIASNMGVSLAGDHSHCRFPSSQEPEFDAFVDKFLRGNADANTTVIKTDSETPDAGYVEADWVDWTTPTLT